MFLAGKIYITYIYAFSFMGSTALFFLFNVMSAKGIGFFQTISTIFYCMLPIILLSAFNIFFDLKGRLGFVFSLVCMIWCTMMATRFVEQIAVMDKQKQRYLLAYP